MVIDSSERVRKLNLIRKITSNKNKNFYIGHKTNALRIVLNCGSSCKWTTVVQLESFPLLIRWFGLAATKERTENHRAWGNDSST